MRAEKLVEGSAAATASYVYDGDGNRVKATFGSGDSAAITAYVNGQVEVGPIYREDFSDGLAQGWTAASGTWAVNGGGYRQSATGSNTNAYRSQTQNQLLVYQWQAAFTSGTNAGLYLFASTATGAERGNSYRIWQDATHVRIYESVNNAATLRASFAAPNAAGQTHSYQVIYDPLTGKLQVWRDSAFLGSWTDATPLPSGSYLSLRTDAASVLFDDLVVAEVIKYYEIGGQRVALRKAGAVSYLFGDHLGSTSVTANASGVRTGELWYKPWGESRGTPFGATPTIYRFTGQREDASVGLYYYGARYCDSALGRFIQADTIVPDLRNPQALNRYSYVLNNPLRYTDPSGNTPGDVVDFIFWGISVFEFASRPTLANAGWALLDTASLLPVLPSVGYFRRGAQALSLYDEIVQFAGRYGDQVLDFARIAHKKGALNLLRKFNLAGANWKMVKGLKAELEYATKFQGEIVEIGRKLEGGAEIDFILKGNVFVNVKNYDWSLEFYQDPRHIQWVIDDFLRQIVRYQQYTDKVKYVFKGGVPDAVRAALEAAGAVVEVIP